MKKSLVAITISLMLAGSSFAGIIVTDRAEPCREGIIVTDRTEGIIVTDFLSDVWSKIKGIIVTDKGEPTCGAAKEGIIVTDRTEGIIVTD